MDIVTRRPIASIGREKGQACEECGTVLAFLSGDVFYTATLKQKEKFGFRFVPGVHERR